MRCSRLRIFRFTLVVLVLLGPALARSQTPAPATPAPLPKPPAEASQFDFWVGDWIFSSPTGGGANRITKRYDGWVIHEDFSGDDKTNLKGMSVSMYNAAGKNGSRPGSTTAAPISRLRAGWTVIA